MASVDFARECGDPSLADAIRELDAAGFSPDGGDSWEGRKLYRAWRDWRRRSSKGQAGGEAPITDLYAPENR